MPGATRIREAIDGGPLNGGAPRVVWQTLGADPRVVSAGSAAQRLSQLGRACHLVWNPLQGEVAQLIPILRAGRLLGWPEDPNRAAASWPGADCVPAPGRTTQEASVADGIAEVNSEGRICAQICVVAFAWEPFTARPMIGLQQLLGWLDSWGIPRQWPAGSPAPFPHGLATSKDRRLWARGGHFGASQVPDLTATGPGAVDVERLTGAVDQPGRATAQTSPVAPDGGRGDGRRPAAAGVRDLDGYFGDREAATAGTLSRVG